MFKVCRFVLLWCFLTNVWAQSGAIGGSQTAQISENEASSCIGAIEQTRLKWLDSEEKLCESAKRRKIDPATIEARCKDIPLLGDSAAYLRKLLREVNEINLKELKGYYKMGSGTADNYLDFQCVAKLRLAKTSTAIAGGTSRIATRFGALAIDRKQGNFFGWSVDASSQESARERSAAECNKYSTSPCSIVMDFTNSCASYAIDAARASSAYGWFYASTKQEADAGAMQECNQRGGSGSQCLLRVWGCTSDPVKANRK